MSVQPQEKDSSPKFFKYALVILPLGLMAGGIISLYFHFTTPKEINPGEKMAKTIVGKDLERYVQTLAEKIGPRHAGKMEALERAAKFIESTLGRNTGYEVRRQTFKAAGEDVHNLIAELKGSSKSDEIVIIGAHYDSVPTSPAADDNASGVAAMMALARAMIAKKPERTIRFVAFVNEEPPYFRSKTTMGSSVYAKLCKERDDNIVAMLSFETMGYYTDEPGSQKVPNGLPKLLPDTGNFIAFISNLDSQELLERTVGLFKHRSIFPVFGEAFPESIEGVGFSDHWSFWQYGYPAVMVTDTAFLRNPHYHQPTDLPDTLNFTKFEQVVLALEDVVWDLANPSTAPPTDYKSRAVELMRGAGTGSGS